MVNAEIVKRVYSELKRGLKEEQIKQMLLSEKYHDYDIDKAISYWKNGGKEKRDKTSEEITKKELPTEESLEGWDREAENQ